MEVSILSTAQKVESGYRWVCRNGHAGNWLPRCTAAECEETWTAAVRWELTANIKLPKANNSPYVCEELPDAAATFNRALALIRGPRRDSYGNRDGCFGLANAAQVWSGILGIPVTASQVALCMTGLKLVREAASHSSDNIDDAAGYLGLLAELEAAAVTAKETKP